MLRGKSNVDALFAEIVLLLEIIKRESRGIFCKALTMLHLNIYKFLSLF